MAKLVKIHLAFGPSETGRRESDLRFGNYF